MFRKSLVEKIVESPWTTLGCGVLAGVAGSYAMSPVTSLLYKYEAEDKKKREESLRKEAPFETLAGRLIEFAGGEPSKERKEKVGMVVHWGYGIGWGVLYSLFRKRLPILRRAFGLPFGVLFFLLGDEVMNSVMGLTAPPKAWPVDAHVRGLAGHIAYAAAAEGVCRAVDAAPALA